MRAAGQGLDMQPGPVTQFVSDEDLAEFLADVAEVLALKMPDHFNLRCERAETTS
jgi:hypothetical protein